MYLVIKTSSLYAISMSSSLELTRKLHFRRGILIFLVIGNLKITLKYVYYPNYSTKYTGYAVAPSSYRRVARLTKAVNK